VFRGISKEPNRDERKVTNSLKLSDDLLKRDRSAGQLNSFCKNASRRSQGACNECLLSGGMALYWSEWKKSGKMRTFFIRKKKGRWHEPTTKSNHS
jgi:hypothetical protein